MNNLTTVVIDYMLTSITGIDSKQLRKAFRKATHTTNEADIVSDSFDDVTKKLNDSKKIIEEVLIKVEEQRKIADQLKQEAETNKQIAALTDEQRQALSRVLEKTLQKNSRRGLVFDALFCILSAIIGFVLGKLF